MKQIGQTSIRPAAVVVEARRSGAGQAREELDDRTAVALMVRLTSAVGGR